MVVFGSLSKYSTLESLLGGPLKWLSIPRSCVLSLQALTVEKPQLLAAVPKSASWACGQHMVGLGFMV